MVIDAAVHPMLKTTDDIREYMQEPLRHEREVGKLFRSHS